MTNVQIDKEGRYTDSSFISLELRQFSKLLKVSPPLSCEEIAQRMAWSKRETRKLLTRFGDKRK